MPILDMRAATFSDRKTIVTPITVALDQGESADIVFESGLAAGIAARLAAGIIKCSGGTVFIGGFDPKIQPVQAKRIVGFVPHEHAGSMPNARAYFAYRAALWEIDPGQAILEGEALLQRFDGLALDQSIALAGALLHRPRLLLLDRPTQLMREAAEDAARDAALFAAHGPGEGAPSASEARLEMAGAIQ